MRSMYSSFSANRQIEQRKEYETLAEQRKYLKKLSRSFKENELNII